ncbi:hypothetical protein [Nocardia nova]|uniref:hypothetical protein n=1 Tax=Nocardia nova TaxID=37330 RepID=UPI001895587A|nr:hypothetical protein [Nocardia nova]MBF6149582.1 hypothetical protein [Nocardia nova]
MPTAGLVTLVIGVLATLWMLAGDNLRAFRARYRPARTSGSISLWLITSAVALAFENTKGRGPIE